MRNYASSSGDKTLPLNGEIQYRSQMFLNMIIKFEKSIQKRILKHANNEDIQLYKLYT